MSPYDYLLRSISDKNNTQKDISIAYAIVIKFEEGKSELQKELWRKINDSIRSRWSERGLEVIKKNTWMIIEAIDAYEYFKKQEQS